VHFTFPAEDRLQVLLSEDSASGEPRVLIQFGDKGPCAWMSLERAEMVAEAIYAIVNKFHAQEE